MDYDEEGLKEKKQYEVYKVVGVVTPILIW